MGALRYELPSPFSSWLDSHPTVWSKLDSFSFISVLNLPLTVPFVKDLERVLFCLLVRGRVVEYA